jgi:hypothetical protein
LQISANSCHYKPRSLHWWQNLAMRFDVFQLGFFLFISLCGLKDNTSCLLYQDPLLSPKHYKKKHTRTTWGFYLKFKMYILEVTCSSFTNGRKKLLIWAHSYLLNCLYELHLSCLHQLHVIHKWALIIWALHHYCESSSISYKVKLICGLLEIIAIQMKQTKRLYHIF